MSTLVIGYGNSLRGDDGAGPAVAARLQDQPALRVLAVHQLTPELAADIAQAESVWFVDAWVGGDKPTVRSLAPAPVTLDHGWQPHVLMHLAKILYGASPQAFQLLIPARRFDYGSSLSAPAEAGVAWAVETIAGAVQEDRPCMR